MRTIIALLLLAVFVTGCSASNTEDSSDPGDEPTLREALEQAGVAIDPDLRSFMQLEEKRATQKYMVAHTFTMSGNGADMTIESVEYQDGADKVRRDSIMPGLLEGRTIELGDRYITCTRMSGSWSCEEMDLSGAEYDFESDEESVDTEAYDFEEVETSATIERDGSETILGQKADCWRITMEGFTGRECRNSKGVMLLTQGTHADGSSIEIRATDYADSVSASDFEPPATPVESGSAEAQDASCRQACVFLELTDAECDDVCAMSAQQPEDYEDYQWE